MLQKAAEISGFFLPEGWEVYLSGPWMTKTGNLLSVPKHCFLSGRWKSSKLLLTKEKN